MKKQCLGFFLFFVLLVVGGVGSPAFAFLTETPIPAVDEKVSLSQENFLAKTDVFKDTPLDLGYLKYTVRLPKGWVKMPSDTDVEESDVVQRSGKELFQQVAKYVSPPDIDKRDMFVIHTLDLRGLISAKNWFINYMLTNGLSAEGITVISDREVNVQFTLLEKTGAFSVRGKVLISGPKVVFVEYKLAAEHQDSHRDFQILALKSFKLLAPDTSPAIRMETFSFVDIAKFDYPKAWILYTPNITTVDRMEASIINLKGNELVGEHNFDIDNLQLDGRVDVTVVARGPDVTIAGEFDILRNSLKKRKLKFGDLIERVDDFEKNPQVLSANVEAYNLLSEEKRMVGYEYWVALLQTPGRHYIFRLLTLGRKDNFYIWAQNVATFKMAIRTLAPVHDDSDYSLSK
jgi:hypothetical protein